MERYNKISTAGSQSTERQEVNFGNTEINLIYDTKGIQSAVQYSEDIDLVQIKAETFGSVMEQWVIYVSHSNFR